MLIFLDLAFGNEYVSSNKTLNIVDYQKKKSDKGRNSAFSAKGKWSVEARAHLGRRNPDSCCSSANNLVGTVACRSVSLSIQQESWELRYLIYRVAIQYGVDVNAVGTMNLLTDKSVSLRPLGDTTDTNSSIYFDFQRVTYSKFF